MLDIANNLQQIQSRIQAAAETCGRNPEAVTLLAVSKTKPVKDVICAIEAGQRCFGESYVQEAVDKIQQIHRDDIEWHFIGPIQSNKSRLIAENFSWVHSVDRLKIAQRLNEQRPAELGLLNVCLQVNVSAEQSKSGVSLDELPALVEAVLKLPQLKLRGLMAIPAKSSFENEQRDAFRKLSDSLVQLNKQFLINMDTLSMGMSNDLEAAVAEGATIVRVGSDIFGSRQGASD
ncbi:MAG: YggS family pyridoxal phosphate-dependent enzyme [Gammaproteobacteria bacterium]|nr:YggS family pyridoxal phosphate-dependent enzyme [Gammaproteobacteria bacterium]